MQHTVLLHNDQYDILKENIADVIKDLMSKSDIRG